MIILIWSSISVLTRTRRREAAAILAFAVAGCAAGAEEQSSAQFSVLSWNVSDSSFVSSPADFGAVISHTSADILLLDEVAPSTTLDQLRAALPDGESGDWYLSRGASGGRQRGVVASRFPIEELPEFAGIVPYGSSFANGAGRRSVLSAGVAVNGAIIVMDDKRLLTVVIDLECCGDNPASWAESKRRDEARQVRDRIRHVLQGTTVDAVILAGDFNLVSTAVPLVIASGPYPEPHFGLIAAEVYHIDGSTTWTWDGRGTPFPSRALDYQMYAPHSLEAIEAVIFDTEDLSPEILAEHSLTALASKRLSQHRPIVVGYAWR